MPRLRRRMDNAMVILNDLLAQCQANTCACVLVPVVKPGEEHKYLPRILLMETYSVIREVKIVVSCIRIDCLHTGNPVARNLVVMNRNNRMPLGEL